MIKIKFNIKELHYLILYIASIGSIGFFTLCAVLQTPYNSSTSNDIYIYYNFIFLILTVVLFIFDIFNKNGKVRKKYLIGVLFIFFYVINIFFITNEGSNIATDIYMQFFVWGITSIISGLLLSNNGNWKKIWSYIDYFMILLTINCSSTGFIFLQNGWRSGTGSGTSYQDASYMAALAIGINLFLLSQKNDTNRARISNLKCYKCFQIILLLIQLFSLIVCGGRGAFVLFLVYFFIFLFNSGLSSIIKKTSMIIVIGLIGIIIASYFGFLNNLTVGLNRIIDFISLSDGIDWNGTSGRDTVYSDVLHIIKNNPFFGYGIFNYRNIYQLPHNIFLELLVQGGIFYAVPFVGILIFSFNKYKKIVKYESCFAIMGIIGLYPIIMLMFSGSYMVTSLFWFVLSLVLCIDL